MNARTSVRFSNERLVYDPPPAMARWLDGIRIADLPDPLDRPTPRRIVPDGTPHLIYYRFGAPGFLAGRRVEAGTTGLTWVGPRSVYRDIERRGRALTVVVTFKPGVGGGLLRFPMDEFADRGTLASEALTAHVGRLRDRLDAAPTVADLIRIFCDELGGVAGRLAPSPLIGEAVRQIQSRPSVRVRDLADHLGVGERRLRERFVREVGLAPKRFARITRMSRVLAGAHSMRPVTWSHVAHEAGYADHSHMVREFRQLLGKPPETFSRRARPSR